VKKLHILHEQFIEKARRPMSFGRLPIRPIEGDTAIVAVDKWRKLESPVRLRKTFKFFSQVARNEFVNQLLGYENDVQHNAVITIDEGEVTLDLRTKDVDQVTEIDKEYAKFSDEIYRDIVYNPPRDE